MTERKKEILSFKIHKLHVEGCLIFFHLVQRIQRFSFCFSGVGEASVTKFTWQRL